MVPAVNIGVVSLGSFGGRIFLYDAVSMVGDQRDLKNGEMNPGLDHAGEWIASRMPQLARISVSVKHEQAK